MGDMSSREGRTGLLPRLSVCVDQSVVGLEGLEPPNQTVMSGRP
jgi:hypothetical protein